MDQLSKEYNVSDEEINEYQTAIETVSRLLTNTNELQKEKEAFELILSVLQQKEFSMKDIHRYMDQFSASVYKTQAEADKFWMNERNTIIHQINDELIKLKTSINNCQSIIEVLKPKMDGNEQIHKVSSLILAERKKLDKLAKYDEELRKTNEKYESLIQVLLSSFQDFINCYSPYIETINNNSSELSDELEFSAHRVFRSEQFQSKLLEIFDNRSIGRFKKINIYKVSEQDVLDKDKIRSLIEVIISNSFTTLKLKGSYSPESALRELFSDWNNVNHIVKMDGDCIEEMSPGKKALVLLRLLISLAESKCPILIDQPEDDLDNRSIFDELIKFLKEKKVDRQIIAVTHNANIVLGGDAELVIVANQQGRNSPNKEYRFEYRGGSIENDTLIKDTLGNTADGILNQRGIQTHICEILEGGQRAFDLRRNKYRFIKS